MIAHLLWTGNGIRSAAAALPLRLRPNQPAEPYFQLSFLSFHAVLISLFLLLLLRFVVFLFRRCHTELYAHSHFALFFSGENERKSAKNIESHILRWPFHLMVALMLMLVVVVVGSLMTCSVCSFCSMPVKVGGKQKEKREEKNTNQSIFLVMKEIWGFFLCPSFCSFLFFSGAVRNGTVWMKLMCTHMALEFLAKWLKIKLCSRRKEVKKKWGHKIKFTWVGILIHFEQKLGTASFPLSTCSCVLSLSLSLKEVK